MSGSGSGSFSHEADFPRGRTSDCSTLIVRTILNSPDSNVLSGLSEGDVLGIEVQNNPTVVVAKTSSGAIAGSLTPPALPKLLSCIGEGYEYVARVESIDQNVCQVTIRPQAQG